jgi:outer membrane receptor protein involved in Fe transport
MLDPDKLPVRVETLSPAEIARFGTPDVLRALDTQAAGISLAGALANPFQPNLIYRGFEASPLAGDAQGLAVYADGVRLNQSFGDTVNWDVIPDIAVDRLTLESSNPVFGLNALGGSLAIRFKNGFSFQGNEAFGAAGSFGRFEGAFQSGVQHGDHAIYVAASHLNEAGWRQHSPSRLDRLFADFAARGEAWQIQLDLIGADTDLAGNGPAPVELLRAARSAVFTYPDRTRNTYGLANVTGSIALSDALSLDSNLYVSRFRQSTRNGDVSSAEPCAFQPSLLCLESGDVVTAAGGTPIAAFPVELAYGQLNRTATATTGFGGALQASYGAALFSRPNRFVAGAAVDTGRTRFSADTELGGLSPDRGFLGPGVIVDQADGEIAPVKVASDNLYLGAYAADVFEITGALSASLSARYNFARLTLQDRLGESLNGRHSYERLNPAGGLTYAILPSLTAYAGYSETNRAPTPAEFSCADEASPCSLTNFFVADPALKQVVAHTAEAGFRGTSSVSADVTVRWHAGVYRSGLDNDIQFVASGIIGRGFFKNIGETRRQGAEVSLDLTTTDWSGSLDYTFTDATYRSGLVLNSPENPLSDANGQIQVTPGNRFASIPAHVVKAAVTRALTPDFSLTLGMRAASGSYLRGDESNVNPKTKAYVAFDLSASYRVNDRIELFASAANLFDAKYETFGAFSPVEQVPLAEAPSASDPRSLSPAPPFSLLGGLRLHL